MQWIWLTGPLVGAVIGYITNDIAVRMMFRPHHQKRILGRRVPFTPGLIPRERPRLARAIREVIDNDLLSPEVLEAALLSEGMIARLTHLADATLEAIFQEEKTPRMLLDERIDPAATDRFLGGAKHAAGLFVMDKIMGSGLEDVMSKAVVEEVEKRLGGGTLGSVAKIFWDERRSASATDALSKAIREMIATHAPQILSGMLDSALHEGLDTPVRTLLQKYEGKTEDIRNVIVGQYRRLIGQVLPGALGLMDLGAIVEEKLNGLSMAELEELIMRVMKKELRAIVWLGALLGGAMGLVNALMLLL